MKTKYGMILLLSCIVLFSYNAFAVDYTLKTTITRTENRSIVPDNSPNCDGSTPSMPTVNYSVTLIDSSVTVFSIKVFKKSDNSLYHSDLNHTIVTSGGGQNYDLATGELTHTITGIPSTKEILIARIYLNSGGTGSPFAEQEFSIAVNSRPAAGFIDVGDIASGTSIGSFGGVVTGGSKSSAGSTSTITVNIEDQEDANYVVAVSVRGLGTDTWDNEQTIPIVTSQSSNSFTVYLEETNNTVQDLRLMFIVQRYQ